MMQETVDAGLGRRLLSWEVDEYPHFERSTAWYVAAAIVSALLMVYAIATANFLFAIIILMIGIITLITTFQAPDRVEIILTTTGVVLGETFYGYDIVKDFALVYKPPETKLLYLDFVSPWHPLVSVPLEETDPNRVRDVLLSFCVENLQRNDESLTDAVRRVYKV